MRNLAYGLAGMVLTILRSDYPSFYTRLYTFLDRDVLHLKHRARFFRMTELFLSSTYVIKESMHVCADFLISPQPSSSLVIGIVCQASRAVVSSCPSRCYCDDNTFHIQYSKKTSSTNGDDPPGA